MSENSVRIDLLGASRIARVVVINPLAPHGGHKLVVETITGDEDAIANMAVIDAIDRAAGMLPRGLGA